METNSPRNRRPQTHRDDDRARGRPPAPVLRMHRIGRSAHASENSILFLPPMRIARGAGQRGGGGLPILGTVQETAGGAGVRGAGMCREMSKHVEFRRLGDGRLAFQGALQTFHDRDVPLFGARVPLAAVEDECGGAKLNRGGDGVVFEEASKTGQRQGFELAHLVEEALVAFATDLDDGLLEARILFVPVVDGGTVDAGGIGGVGDGAALGQGQDGPGLIGGKAAESVEICRKLSNHRIPASKPTVLGDDVLELLNRNKFPCHMPNRIWSPQKVRPLV